MFSLLHGLEDTTVFLCAHAREPSAATLHSMCAREAQSDSRRRTAKQAAARRIWSSEIALSPQRMRYVASDPTCTRITSSTSQSQMCARGCTHPLGAIVRAGVRGWVLEHGEGVREGGQQLLVHGDFRRTVD